MFLKRRGQIQFGEFVFDPGEVALFRNGAPVQLPLKALKLLAVLIENRGHILEKNTLLDQVWADSFVEEGNLPYTVRLLRKTLGDDADTPRFIETIRGRGYRFIAPEAVKPNPRRAAVGNVVPIDVDFTDKNALIGREKELADIRRVLASDKTRLLTMTGPGGTGKTSLALEIAREVENDFPDGVCLVDLTVVTNPALVADAIAHELGIKHAGTRPILEVLSEHLGERSMLLVLDNFEQIVSAGVQLGQILRAAPDVKILVTSREPLKLTIETEYRVPPLAVPSTGDVTETISDVMRFGAIELFLRRARMARPDIGVSDKDAHDLSGICNKLDGLPLALELAASRVNVLSFREILQKLENQLALLTGGSRDMPGRQQTMRATIEWSFGLLSDRDKEVFADLAVFEGGFSFGAAESILVAANARARSLSETDVLDAVTSLNEKGLLLSNKLAGGEMRFRMLVVVRDYALEVLAASGNAGPMSRAHAEYFRDLAAKAAPYLISNESAEWLDRLETEHDNLRAAMRWSLEAKPEIAAQIASSLRNMWTIHGHIREGQHWPEEILKKGTEISPELRWELLTGLGNSAQFRGDLDYARDVYAQSLEVSRAAGDRAKVARALRGLAAVEYMRCNFESARGYIEEALVISQQLEDDLGVGAAYARLGDISLAEGNASDARVWTGRGLEIFHKIGYKQGIAAKSINLGLAAIADDDTHSGREHLEVGVRLSLAHNDKMNLQLGLYGFAALFFEQREFQKAARFYSAGQHIGEEIEKSVLEPAEDRFRDTLIKKLQTEMSDRELNEALAEGRRGIVSEYVELALGESDRSETRRRHLRRVDTASGPA